MSLPRQLPAALACAALAVVLAGCGAGGSGSGSSAAPTSAGAAASSALPTPTKDDALAAKVPQSVAADGKLVFGTDPSYPPNEFTGPDGTTIIGMDVDLGTAVGQKLGLTVEFQNSAFPGIIPGLRRGKYELGMSSFSINPERVQTVDMVTYFSAGTSVGVKSGNPDNINPDDLCGKAVGVQAGTVQVDDVAARNQKCTAAGKPAIQVTEFPGADRRERWRSTANRIDAMLADSPVVDYAVKTDRRRSRGRRPALRHRAVRHRAQEGPDRVRPGRPGRRAGADQRRHLREDPRQVERRPAGRSRSRRSTRAI